MLITLRSFGGKNKLMTVKARIHVFKNVSMYYAMMLFDVQSCTENKQDSKIKTRFLYFFGVHFEFKAEHYS